MQRPSVLVTGASGLLGTALAARRAIQPLPRRDPGGGGPWWEPLKGRVHDNGRPIAAIVHLAGESVADGRWNEERMREIRESRVQGSRTLVEWLRHRPQRPSVLIAASGISFYGDRGDELLPESAGPGPGFLAEVTHDWEAELARAEEIGIRTVILRLGIVLSRDGGALPRMLPAFKAGLGGPIGNGRQWFPWVHIDDVVGVIDGAIESTTFSGTYNLVAPGIVRQRDFAASLGRVLRRPAIIRTPATLLKLAFGGIAEEGLLASLRVIPHRLKEEGYPFRFPELDPALRDVLERRPTTPQGA